MVWYSHLFQNFPQFIVIYCDFPQFIVVGIATFIITTAVKKKKKQNLKIESYIFITVQNLELKARTQHRSSPCCQVERDSSSGVQLIMLRFIILL